MIPTAVQEYIDKSYAGSLPDLLDFLSLPDISSVKSHGGDVRRAAEWLLARLRKTGLDGTLFETPGHPVVYAELCHGDRPTLMFYAHYDVAPPGPPDEWATPPFSPVLKDDRIFGRGAVDDKGQLFTILQAIEAILATEGRLPVNVKLLFEGEEEAGSPSLEAFVNGHREMLKADAVIVVDLLKYRADLPAIYYGAKGLLTVALQVSGPSIDVHSGIYGGEIANPAGALCHIVDRLKDSDGKILIPGFYDLVRDVTPAEKAEIAALPFDVEAITARLEVDALAPEKGYTPLECAMARPTLDVNGIWGGAQPGEPLMVIPAEAGAYISMRLVSGQSPDEIYSQLKAYVSSLAPPGVRVRLRKLFSDEPFATALDSDVIQVSSRAISYAFGARPVLVRSGGTSAVVALLGKATGIKDIIVTGWGDPGDGEHSPDEHFSLENYRKGIIATAAIIYGFTEGTEGTEGTEATDISKP